MKLLTACPRCWRVYLVDPNALVRCIVCKDMPLRSIMLDFEFMQK